jgi:lauroyl/myristoyl acyltransferase
MAQSADALAEPAMPFWRSVEYGAYIVAGALFKVTSLALRRRLAHGLAQLLVAYKTKLNLKKSVAENFFRQLESLDGRVRNPKRAKQQFVSSVESFLARELDLLWLQHASRSQIRRTVATTAPSLSGTELRGRLYVVPHVGGPNMFHAALAATGTRPVVVTLPTSSPARNRLRSKILSRVGADVLQFDPGDSSGATSEHAVFSQLNERLRNGQSVVIMADLDGDRYSSNTPQTPLLGGAYLNPLVHRLTEAGHTQVVVAAAVLRSSGYSLEASPVLSAGHDGKTLTQLIAERVTELERRYALQFIGSGEKSVLDDPVADSASARRHIRWRPRSRHREALDEPRVPELGPSIRDDLSASRPEQGHGGPPGGPDFPEL